MRYLSEHPYAWKFAATIAILLFCLVLARYQRRYGKLKESWDAACERGDATGNAHDLARFYGLRAGILTVLILFALFVNIAYWIWG